MEGFTTKKQPFTTVWKMHTAGDAQWYPAQVPGTVYTDLLRNGQMEDPFWKDNEYKALDLMEKDYEYETVFEGVEAQAGEKQWLRFEGLDTICDGLVNRITTPIPTASATVANPLVTERSCLREACQIAQAISGRATGNQPSSGRPPRTITRTAVTAVIAVYVISAGRNPARRAGAACSHNPSALKAK